MTRKLWLIIATLSGAAIGKWLAPVHGDLIAVLWILGGAFVGQMAGFVSDAIVARIRRG
jgi:hypothetical protein